MIIGVNNGWLFRNGITSLSKQAKKIKELGGNGVELSLLYTDDLRLKSYNKMEDINLEHVSFHLPKDEGLLENIPLYKKLHEKYGIKSFVVHPDGLTNEDWTKLTSEGLPISIENMDSRKKSGFLIEELKELVEKYNTKFILDVQHAYEHDPEMNYGWELFQEFKDKLTHLHVSGWTDNKLHVPVNLAKNKDAIVNFVKRVMSEKKLPIILEGVSSAEELREEIKFLREILS